MTKVIGVFADSSLADICAASLQHEFPLSSGEVDMLDLASTPAAPTKSEDDVIVRWGDKVLDGDTVVVARCHDVGMVGPMSEMMRQLGADAVDVIEE